MSGQKGVQPKGGRGQLASMHFGSTSLSCVGGSGSSWGTSLGGDKLGARDKILNTAPRANIPPMTQRRGGGGAGKSVDMIQRYLLKRILSTQHSFQCMFEGRVLLGQVDRTRLQTFLARHLAEAEI